MDWMGWDGVNGLDELEGVGMACERFHEPGRDEWKETRRMSGEEELKRVDEMN